MKTVFYYKCLFLSYDSHNNISEYSEVNKGNLIWDPLNSKPYILHIQREMIGQMQKINEEKGAKKMQSIFITCLKHLQSALSEV